MGGSSAPDHPDLPTDRHEDGAKGAQVLRVSHVRSTAPDHLDLPGNGHEDGTKGGQVLSVSHKRDQCLDHLDLPGNGHEDGAKGSQVLRVSHGRSSSWTTQTYLAMGMRMEQKAARYSASPMGGSSAPDHPDLPGNRH
jgi:hypothetical protein